MIARRLIVPSFEDSMKPAEESTFSLPHRSCWELSSVRDLALPQPFQRTGMGLFRS